MLGRRAVGAAFAGILSLCGGCGTAPSPAPSPSGDAGGVQAPASSPPAAPQPPPGAFSDVAPASGLEFRHFLGATGKWYFPEIMGSGCALFDADGDGDLDAYLVQGTVLEPGKGAADSSFPYQGPLPPRSRLFRNDMVPGGPLRFTDVTEASGAGFTGYGMGTATGDYDNDGDVDLYVTGYTQDALFRNDGNGSFTDVTARAGVGDPRWTSSASFFDYDGDGWLDLAVAAYCDSTVANHKNCYSESGALDYCGPTAYQAIPARLYRNTRRGGFEDVTGESGIDAAYGHGLGILAADVDGDGRQDLFVANDSDRNLLFVNRGGRFEEEGILRGVAFSERGVAEAGMGVAAEDVDGDGDLDLFVTNLIRETNVLSKNVEGGFFEDATSMSGLGLPGLPYTAFGVAWFDADHDGDLDLFVANGDVRVVETRLGSAYPFDMPNQLMMQAASGVFEDGARAWGIAALPSEVSRGVCSGDVDNDGDVDLLVTNNNGPARLLRNDLHRRGRYLVLRVLDEAHRRDAIGAIVRVGLSDGRSMTRRVHTDGSYLSSSDPRVHFGWPEGVELDSVVITPPGGEPLRVDGILPDAFQTVRLGRAGAVVSR